MVVGFAISGNGMMEGEPFPDFESLFPFLQ